MDNFGQVWASLGKLGQVRTRQQIRKIGGKGRKNKKREKYLSGEKKKKKEEKEEKVRSRIRRRLSAN